MSTALMWRLLLVILGMSGLLYCMVPSLHMP